MSDTGSNDPNDPYRANQPDPNEPPPPPAAPRWGSNPPSTPEPDQPGSGGEWTGGQLGQYDQPAPGQPQYGQAQGQQPQYGQPQSQPWQPQYGQGGPPPDYLVWAILSTLFCCAPLGIPSIVYAARVKAMYEGGNAAGALESSRKAKQFAIWSAAVMVILYALFLVVVIIGAAAESS